MAEVTYDKSGPHEAIASAWTLMLYEQEFSTDERHASLIGDVYGRIDLTKGGTEVVSAAFVEQRLQGAMEDGKELPKTTRRLVRKAFPAQVLTEIDYTADNWEADLRALWAMLRTADDARLNADPLGVPSVPRSYETWVRGLDGIDLRAVSSFVVGQCQSAYFQA